MKRSFKIITAVVVTAGIVAGAAAYGKHEFGSPERRAAAMVSFVSGELDLNDSQEQSLIVLKDEVLAAREIMEDQMKPTKQELAALLEAERFDQARALEIINAKTTAINQAAPAVVAAFGNFLDGLDAEQKAEIRKFKERAKDRRGRWSDHD